ncbi:DUF2243 domain-containing protein [Sphingomonas sp.]|jgi:uncharacterized membrane protein|uniref:DUF2243 domain-containing protein n=1 Tax=Sphingomonas sp. TaxID=28214 RepID=UPI002DF5175D|nr:DUF2243 domain-containing protein [Sphingomonas sp.]
MISFVRDRLLVACAIVGVGLSGFFDGILLHQVLQWHHLLSLVPGERLQDIGNQIFADGMFHVLMYLVTGFGLYRLYLAREDLRLAGAGRRAIAGALLGFGLWNIVDVAGFHWLLGIHRIRVNVPNPMLYDVGWLTLLGLLPVAVGVTLVRRRGGMAGSSAGAILPALALIAAPLASLPAPGSTSALVVFPHSYGAANALNAVISSHSGILWADTAGRFVAVRLQDDSSAKQLYQSGALLVTRSPALAGCVAAVS